MSGGGQTSLAGLFWLRSVETEKALEELRASPSTLRGESEREAKAIPPSISDRT
jgi:hypothetical protein